MIPQHRTDAVIAGLVVAVLAAALVPAILAARDGSFRPLVAAAVAAGLGVAALAVGWLAKRRR